jgi:hypothetical protein
MLEALLRLGYFMLGERKKDEGGDEEELNGTGMCKDGGVCMSVSTLYLSSSDLRVIR